MTTIAAILVSWVVVSVPLGMVVGRILRGRHDG